MFVIIKPILRLHRESYQLEDEATYSHVGDNIGALFLLLLWAFEQQGEYSTVDKT